MPRISIITPSYNHGQFIERTIDSVLSQNYVDLEYIIIDGSSSDDTLDILRRHDSHIDWISEPDGGQVDAVNKGLARASGDIIGWLNSDDVYHSGALAKVSAFFATHPAVDVVYGQADNIGVDDVLLGSYPVQTWNLERLMDECYISQPATFFRRRVIDQFGLLDSRYAHCLDYEYWIRLARGGALFVHLPETLASTRVHAETITQRQRVQVHSTINHMLCHHNGAVPDKWLYNYAHAVLDRAGTARHHRTRFALLVSLLSIMAALRWNHRVTGVMWRTTWAWVRGSRH